MMEFIHEPFEHPFEHPFHHHHHEVNPIELAQIGGASQYAKLSYRLQKHIEDDTRHITDEERYKWNKTYNDLKALKEDIEDGVVAGGISINDVRDYLESMNYATKTWVNELGFLKDFDVQQLINLYLQNRGILTKDDLNSALKDYIKLKGYLGTIDGQPFYQGDAITTKGGNGGGLSWSDIISGLSYNAYVNESTYGAQAIGEVRANGQSLFTIYQTDFGGDGISQLPIATTSVLGGIKAGEAYNTNTPNATRYFVQVNDQGTASVVIPNRGGNDDPVTGDVYNWNPFFTLYPSNKSADKPQLPNPTTGTWSYGSYTWTDQAPNGNDDYFVWMCLVEYKNSTPTGNVNGPICLGADPGADANGMEFVYRRWYTESAADVVGNLHAGTTNAGKTPADEDYVPSDWTDHPTGIDKDMRYEYMAYRTSTLVDNKRTWSNNFSEPFLWSKWGQDGTDGDGIEFIFSSAVDLTTTQATMKISLTNALTQVFGSNYTANYTYQTANEVANVIIDGKSLDSLGWHDNAPQIALGQCVYVSIRKKRWDSNEEKVRWGEFSDPVIWSGVSTNTSIIEGGTLYYLTVTPTLVHVDANGVKDADKIYARLYRSDENGTTEMTPTSAPNKYIMRYQFSNQLAEPTPFDNSAYTPNGYELTLTDASSVTISATNFDGSIQLCQAVTVSQIVDGSIVYGANAIDVNVLNDVLSIGADSENYVMRNISGENVTIHAFIGGDSIISNCTIKYNNTTLRSGNTSTVVAKSNTTSNTFNVSVYPTYSSNEITLRLGTSVPTSQQIDSSYSIPLQLLYTEDGQYYTRLFDIKINRINSGAKGVAPTLIRLLVNRDTIYYRENDFYDTRTITGKIEYTNSDGEWKVYNSSTPRPAGLPLFILRTVGVDGSSNAQSASQFSWSRDTWTLTAASRPSQLFNLYGTQFLILAVGQLDNSIIYDQETVNFIKEGKDGTNGTNGSQGLQGCVVRESLIDDGTSDTIYRNDSNWFTTSQIRYIDVVGVPSSKPAANKDGFEWFIVKPSGTVSTAENTGSNKISYSTAESELKTYVAAEHHAPLVNFEVLSNVGGIYSSFILAKNAKIKFQTSNELTIVGSDNSTIVAGLTGGGDSDNGVRIWAGTTESDVNNAPFRVYEDGSLVATNATIYGQVIAEGGKFTGELQGPNNGIIVNGNGSGSIANGRIYWDENGLYIKDFTLIGGEGSHTGGGSTSDPVYINDSGVTFRKNNNNSVHVEIPIVNTTGKTVVGSIDIWSHSDQGTQSGGLVVPYWTADAVVSFEVAATDTNPTLRYDIPMYSATNNYTGDVDTSKRSQIAHAEAWVFLSHYNVDPVQNDAKHWTPSSIWPD